MSQRTAISTPRPGPDAEKVEPAILSETLSDKVTEVLNSNETITVFEPCLQYSVIGTSTGSIFIFDSECNLVVCNRGLHEGPITCLHCHQCTVLSGCTTGSIAAYNWLTNNQVIYGPNYSEPVTAVAPALGFSFQDGPIYFGTSTGSVVKRSRGLLYGYNDHVLFSNVSADAPVFEAIWYGYAQSVQADTQIEHLYRAPPYLFVAWPSSFLLYHERRDAIAARVYKPTGDSSVNRCKLFVDDTHCLIACGSRVYICNRNWDVEPFHVKKIYDIDSSRPIAALTFINDLIAVAYVPTGARRMLPSEHAPTARQPGSDSDPRDDKQANSGQGPSKPVAVEPSNVKAKTRYSDFALVFHKPDTFEPVDACTVPSIEPADGKHSTFVCMKTAITNAFDDVSMQSLPTFATTTNASERISRTYIVRARELHSVRSMKPAERVVWLVREGNFPRAIHLCKAAKKPAALREVADAYATHLWENCGEYRKAVAVYAEYILPSAPRAYWTALAARLEKAGYLPLIEKYLPFNNRKVLPASTYTHILDHYLKQRDYRGFHSRISRWPVVYSVSKVIRRITDLLDAHHPHQKGAHSEPSDSGPPFNSPGMAGSSSGHVVDAENGFGEGRSRGASASSTGPHPYTFGLRDRAVSGSEDFQGSREDSPGNIQYLYMSLFKLHEFQSNFVEALRVLIKMRSTNVMDYFDAHRLWNHFSLSSMANDVLRRALGTQLDVLGLDSGDGEDEVDEEAERPPSPSYFGMREGAVDGGSDVDDDSSDSSRDKGDSGGFYKSDLLEERRHLLVEMFAFNSDAIIEVLVNHRNDVSLHDLVRLLQPYPAYRLKYLAAMATIDMQRCAPYHHDMISLYLAAIRGDFQDTQGLIPSDPSDLEDALCPILETSATFDYPAVVEECKTLRLFKASQVLINRQETSAS